MDYKILEFDEIANLQPNAEVLPVSPRQLEAALTSNDLQNLDLPSPSNRNLWLFGIALGVGAIGTTIYFLVREHQKAKEQEAEWDNFTAAEDILAEAMEDENPEQEQEIWEEPKHLRPRRKRRRVYHR